jgi:glycerol kinase
MSVLAIDQGTSGTKAIVVDDAGVVRAVVEVPVRPVYLAGGGVEQDPGQLLASVLEAGRQACAAAGLSIDAVALANQGETVLAWDPDTGRPLSQAIVWQDNRSGGICEGLSAHAELIALRTGLVLDPYFSAPKMTWLRRNITLEGVVTTTDAWLVHHLTGEFVSDITTASRSLVLDLDTTRWDPELLGIFGLEGERLPRLVACDEIVGSTTAFGPEVPVVGLIVDQQAALLAEGCLAPGMAKCTYGTGAFVLASTGADAVRSTTGLTTSVAWRMRGTTEYCVDGQVLTAGSAVRWLEDLGIIASAAGVDAAAASDSGGVLFIPALAGLAAPWWRSDAQAAFTGMSLSTGASHLVRAVIDGIAAQIADLVRVIAEDTGVPIARLRVDGGLTNSRVLMQAQADLLQAPVDVYPSAHATALGAAALARLALDPTLRPADAVGGWAPSTTYEPRMSADEAAYHLGAWRSAIERVMPKVEP